MPLGARTARLSSAPTTSFWSPGPENASLVITTGATGWFGLGAYRRVGGLADVDFRAVGVSAAMGGDVDVVIVAVPRS